MKKIFGELNITWKSLIIFAILIGIGIGILNNIQILNNTSFQDIAIVFDMWIILAIIVIVNCKDWKEAVAKCFVFFLISQPMIYFTEVLINTFIYKADFAETFILYFKNYYIGAGWLAWTFLTIPGAFIAYQIKRNNVLSALILSVATFYLSTKGTIDLINCITQNFPYHLLNSLICLVMAFVLIFVILKNKRERIISLIITIIGIGVGIFILITSNNEPMIIDEMIKLEGNINIVECTVENENIATAKIKENGEYITVYSSKEVGTTKMEIKDELGNIYVYTIESTSKKFNITQE